MHNASSFTSVCYYFCLTRILQPAWPSLVPPCATSTVQFWQMTTSPLASPLFTQPLDQLLRCQPCDFLNTVFSCSEKLENLDKCQLQRNIQIIVITTRVGGLGREAGEGGCSKYIPHYNGRKEETIKQNGLSALFPVHAILKQAL